MKSYDQKRRIKEKEGGDLEICRDSSSRKRKNGVVCRESEWEVSDSELKRRSVRLQELKPAASSEKEKSDSTRARGFGFSGVAEENKGGWMFDMSSVQAERQEWCCLLLKVWQKTLLLRLPQEVQPEMDVGAKIERLLYFLHNGLPVLRHIYKEQSSELDTEAKIRGNQLQEINITRTKLDGSERLYCDNCNTSIVGFYRSCPNPCCSYDLCLACCQELRNGWQPGGIEAETLNEQFVEKDGYQDSTRTCSKNNTDRHDEHISSALEDSTVKLESSSASGDSSLTVELEIPSASEGPTVKLETTDTEQLGESRNCSASGRNVVERNCFAEGDVRTISAEVSDYAKTFRQKHELTQSASNLTSGCKNSICK